MKNTNISGLRDGTEKRHPVRCIVLVLLCVLTVFYAVPKWSLVIPVSAATSVAEDQQRVKKMQEELSLLKNSRKNATDEYNAALAEYNKAMLDIDNAYKAKELLDKEIAALEEETEKTQELLNTYTEQLDTYAVLIADKQDEIEDRYAKFVERIRVNYEDSFTSYLEIVLESNSFADFLYHIDVVASLLDYDKRVLAALAQSKDDLSSMQNQYQALQYGAQNTLSDLVEQMPILEKKRAEGEQMLIELEEAVAAAKANKEATEEEKRKVDAAVSSMEQRVKVAEAEIDKKIKEAQERERREKYVGGTFGWPVDIGYNKVSSYFSVRYNPVYGYQELHNGIDIPVPYGTAILAGNAGTVIVSEWHYSYGNYVVIDHGGGITTLYAHNSKLLVKVGDTVSKGQTIAKAGSTGYSTGNHCHFSVRENGVAVNPLNYVVQP
ncbi:MAG: peptidoglycan DD-metalloendopeptidase family protein [Clostridia bacterium]|nr:peptidoglycan DD-metalloendopeptidase family protein [Clostridia bacterium]